MGQRSGTSDAVLDELLSPLEEALTSGGPVVALSCWQVPPTLALLPAHLQLRRPDRLAGLPLVFSAGLIPCSGADRQVLREARYCPKDSYAARRVARWYRHESRTALPDNAVLADWEEGYRRHQAKFDDRLLGADSFLAVDVVGPRGHLRSGSRPVLGRHTGRSAPRPAVLIPGRGTLDATAAAQLAGSDLLLLGLAGLRGPRGMALARLLLGIRGHRPTLALAVSPADLLRLTDPVLAHAPLRLLAPVPTINVARVLLVCRERALEERRMTGLLAALGEELALRPALALAHAAWWSARDALVPSAGRGGAYMQLILEQERLSGSDPSLARSLGVVRTLLDESFEDTSRAGERLAACVNACVEAILRVGSQRIGIVLRDPAEIEPLWVALSAHWGASQAELQAAGLAVGTLVTTPTERQVLILHGYAGMRSLDVCLASGAPEVWLILDPVEADMALGHIRRYELVLDRAGSAAPKGVFVALTTALAAIAAPMSTLGDVAVNLAADLSAAPTEYDDLTFAPTSNRDEGVGGQLVQIVFTDGSTLYCPTDQRFDLLGGSAGGALVPTAAGELSEGDEIVLIVNDQRTLFSGRLLAYVDAGDGREDAEQRALWRTLISSVMGATPRSVRDVRMALANEGLHVSLATVRSWVDPVRLSGEGTVPRTWKNFQLLAQVLGLTLTPADLRDIYAGVRRLRIRHRLAGRTLVRLLRHAAAGDLDLATIDRARMRWGLDARELLEGTQVLIVDHVRNERP